MSKALQERLYILRRFFTTPGWVWPNCLESGKKYEAIIDKLTRDGLLEKHPESKLWRLTDKGYPQSRVDGA